MTGERHVTAGALFAPFATRAESIKVAPALAAKARLTEWARDFQLGTAGWRDLLDPADMHNLAVPFNSLTVAIVVCARAQLALEEGQPNLHVGGEVRPHTQAFIDLAARIYAAHGLEVYLRPPEFPTTPIWLSSFGVFYEELAGGENFTASHSPAYKGGWKPMDHNGMQLLALAGRVAERVKALAGIAATEGLEIPLAAADDPRIRRDFDPVAAYVDSLLAVVPSGLLAEIREAAARGFRAAFCTQGGSMAASAQRVFAGLGIDCGAGAPVFFTHAEERADYHGIGVVDGVNHGVDPGKWQVYKRVGAQELLRRGEAAVFFIWDPDGDRFNMVTVAPGDLAARAGAAGLEVDPLDDQRCLVFFKPNQLYFLLTALKLECLREQDALDARDWIIATTFPTSRSIGELAEAFNGAHGAALRTFRVPVGFKHFGGLVADLETQLLGEESAMPVADDDEDDQAQADEPAVLTHATDVTGMRTLLGTRPRLLIMAEESGGATMGPGDWQVSRHGANLSLALKEKDGMQIGVMALALAARLHRRQSSFAAHYLELLDRYAIRHRFYERRDVTLFDESLRGEAREAARAAGNAHKDVIVGFVRSLTELAPGPATAALQARLPAGIALPPIRRLFWAGDGTLIEWDELWFQLRASGTDAVLRFYMEGENRETVSRLNEAMTKLSAGPAPPST